MSIIVQLCQLIIVLGIINVWFVRRHQSTNYRGKNATSLKDEFQSYGYPSWFFYVIGGLKILFALVMSIGFWAPVCIPIAAAGLGILMLGAVVSHFKVNDAPIKYMPATIMLALCGVVFALTYQYLPIS